METQEFFKQWHSKYPISFNKFKIFFMMNCDDFIGFNIDNGHIYFTKHFTEEKIDAPFEMLIGIINKFYCENGIIIIENYDRKTKKYLKTIFSGRNLENEIDINDNENYKELNYDCFLYAAEILEKELS